jgi:hypothetical protein
MIHQFIFAGPKPGLSAEDFQSYWLDVHAVNYASKIAQIRQYLIATRLRISCPRELPFFEGVAEIWLKNDQEQLESLQTPEFLEGARLDEPKWAAFWQTLVIDTDPEVLLESKEPAAEFIKLYVLIKRRSDSSLEEFRHAMLEPHGQTALKLPGLERYLIGFSRAGGYGLGEPRFDAIEVYSFPSAAAVEAALASEEWRAAEESLLACADPRYIFNYVGQDHWVIPPGVR